MILSLSLTQNSHSFMQKHDTFTKYCETFMILHDTLSPLFFFAILSKEAVCFHTSECCHAWHGDDVADVSVEQPIGSVWTSERKTSFIFKENSVLPLLSSCFQKAIFFQTRHMMKWFNSPSHTDFLKMNHVNHRLCFNHQSGTDPFPPLPFS